jgi:thioredoxin 1
MNNLLNISNEKDLSNLFNNIQDKLIVLYFTAKWCGPCKSIKPKYEEFARNHITSIFGVIDIDIYQDNQFKFVSAITSVPTFDFYFAGAKIGSVQGADINSLLHHINAGEQFVIQNLQVKSQQQIQAKNAMTTQIPNQMSNHIQNQMQPNQMQPNQMQPNQMQPNQMPNQMQPNNGGYYNPYTNTYVQSPNQYTNPNPNMGTPIANIGQQNVPISMPMQQPMTMPMQQPMTMPMQQPMAMPQSNSMVSQQDLAPLIAQIVMQTLQTVQSQSQAQPVVQQPIAPLQPQPPTQSVGSPSGQIVQLPNGQLLLLTSDGRSILLAANTEQPKVVKDAVVPAVSTVPAVMQSSPTQ